MSSLFSSSHLKEPIAASVEGRKDGRVDVAAVDALQCEKYSQYLQACSGQYLQVSIYGGVVMWRVCEAGVFRHLRPWGVSWEAWAQLGGTGGWLKSRLASPPLNGQGARKVGEGGMGGGGLGWGGLLGHLHPLDFQLHVVLPCSLPVLPLLPTVAVSAVTNLKIIGWTNTRTHQIRKQFSPSSASREAWSRILVGSSPPLTSSRGADQMQSALRQFPGLKSQFRAVVFFQPPNWEMEQLRNWRCDKSCGGSLARDDLLNWKEQPKRVNGKRGRIRSNDANGQSIEIFMPQNFIVLSRSQNVLQYWIECRWM